MQIVLLKNITSVQQLHLINTMSTVESLDLATLQNNPQSIAEALEDVLETTDGTIGSLKTSAQSKKDDIDDLYDDALTAKNQIDSLLSSANSVEEYYSNTLLNSWVAWDITSTPTDEHGIRVQRYGKIYIVQLSVYKPNVDQNTSLSQTIKTLTSSDITLPSQKINMGLNVYGSPSETDIISSLTFSTNGDITIYFLQFTGSTFHITGNFMGVDQG